MSDPVLTNIYADLAALKLKYAARSLTTYIISPEYIFIHVPPPVVVSTVGKGATSE